MHFFCSQDFALQVWALAVGKKTEKLATGGGDAVINLWNDSTAADKEEAFHKEVCPFIYASSTLNAFCVEEHILE